MEFIDRVLKCSDCGSDFIFTAGEQLFFFDRQFKNDPKRCKLCKAKRAGLGRAADGAAQAALPLSRTETRTQCSACGVETTVPFKPTQGRPVFCRSCFQLKRVPAAVAKAASLDTPELAVEQAVAEAVSGMERFEASEPASDRHMALTGEPASQVIELMAQEAAQA
jgi:CxxC-x17-CxxC domain-containing protein